MYVPDVELHEAPTLNEVGILLRRHAPAVRLLAGGTDLLVDLKTGRISTQHLVSLRQIPGLRGVSETAHGLQIGALTTISQLLASPVIQDRYAALLDAASLMAAPQVRNLATVGGNLASAVPCADLPPILIAMNAQVRLWSPTGERDVPLDQFFAGPRQTVRRDDEVLTSVLVPNPPPHFGAAYARFALRDGNAIAVAAVAASLLLNGDRTVRDARIVLGAVAPVPLLAHDAARILLNVTPSDEAFQRVGAAAMAAAQPISDVRGSAEFRRDLVGVLTRRALHTALSRAKEAR